jgi:hypothetical protein
MSISRSRIVRRSVFGCMPSNRSGHKRLVFRVTAYVFLHKRTNHNDNQLVLERLFECSMDYLRAHALAFKGQRTFCVRQE